jgi:hypothetical protein
LSDILVKFFDFLFSFSKFFLTLNFLNTHCLGLLSLWLDISEDNIGLKGSIGPTEKTSDGTRTSLDYLSESISITLVLVELLVNQGLSFLGSIWFTLGNLILLQVLYKTHISKKTNLDRWP